VESLASGDGAVGLDDVGAWAGESKKVGAEGKGAGSSSRGGGAS
jgi:hypothetical protein